MGLRKRLLIFALLLSQQAAQAGSLIGWLGSLLESSSSSSLERLQKRLADQITELNQAKDRSHLPVTGSPAINKLHETIRQLFKLAEVDFELITNGDHSAYQILASGKSKLNLFSKKLFEINGAEIIYDPIELLHDRIDARYYSLSPNGNLGGRVLMSHDSAINLSPLTRSTLHEALHLWDEHNARQGKSVPLAGRIKPHDGNPGLSVNDYSLGMELRELRNHSFNLWWEALELRNALATSDSKAQQNALSDFERVLKAAIRVKKIASRVFELPCRLGRRSQNEETRLPNGNTFDITIPGQASYFIEFKQEPVPITATIHFSPLSGGEFIFSTKLHKSQGAYEANNEVLFDQSIGQLKTEVTEYSTVIESIASDFAAIKKLQKTQSQRVMIQESLSKLEALLDYRALLNNFCHQALMPSINQIHHR